MEPAKAKCCVKGCRNSGENTDEGVSVCWRHRTGRLITVHRDGLCVLTENRREVARWVETSAPTYPVKED
jgi:hypothetical protein